MLGAIGLGMSAIGAIGSAVGASQNAKAMQAASENAIKRERKMYLKWAGKLDTLIGEQEDKLYNLGDIFDRFESTGAFGDTNVLADMRKAQEDFSALAAGDFTGFETQLRKSMSDALVGTVGTGSPIGAYAQLAADTQFDYRQKGLQTAMGVTEFLSNEANKLLGLEFGVMDKGFDKGYQMDRAKTSNINNYKMMSASAEGVGLTATGNAVSQIGSGLFSFGKYLDTRQLQQQSMAMGYANLYGAPRAIDIATQMAYPRAGATTSNFRSMGGSLGNINSGYAGDTVPGLPSNNPLPVAGNNWGNLYNGINRWFTNNPGNTGLPPIMENADPEWDARFLYDPAGSRSYELSY